MENKISLWRASVFVEDSIRAESARLAPLIQAGGPVACPERAGREVFKAVHRVYAQMYSPPAVAYDVVNRTGNLGERFV